MTLGKLCPHDPNRAGVVYNEGRGYIMEMHDRSLTADPQNEREQLLRLARLSIRAALANEERYPFETDDPWLLRPAAVFVTLRERPENGQREGELRGCIGHLETDTPLYLAVQDMAVRAATVDPRFGPLTLDELDDVSVEISILSPMRPVRQLSDIHIGQDGLLVVGSRRRGLLLPEVAPAYGWNEREYVRHVCHKAGLPYDAWPEKAQLYAFTTDSFDDAAGHE